ncbi:MAG: glycosyl hydrolase family 8 [Fibromonadales bacterium]|nr:glycosyl hydrolase family 8 [Fibromonadales bacterium]
MNRLFRPLFAAIISLAMLSIPAFAVLEIPNAQPKVGAKQWKQVLDSTWAGLVKRNIDDCVGKSIYNGHPNSRGLICRPKSETPWDAVSEGIGYGMLLALYADDQPRFNQIYKAGKEFGLNYCQGWRKPANGGGTESGSATDADEDIAIALVFADKLAKKGLWSTPSDINYANDAQSAISCVWGSMQGGKLCPGNAWCPGYNVGYFAPAWYRVFKNYTTNSSQNWQLAIDESYKLIAHSNNTGYSKGMVPDWSSDQGVPGGGGYNTYRSGQAFFKDAIRVLWRVANDAIWFNEPRAKTFLTNSLDFIKSKGGPDAANFYDLNGNLVPADDKWAEFNDQNNSSTWRYRREHSHLTVGQWLIPAMAVGSDEDKIAWSSKMAEFYDWENKVNFFGNATDPNPGGIEDTMHNEMYFDQFLAWFGVSLMSGTWVNIIELLDNPVKNTEGITTQPYPEPEPPIDPDPIIIKGTQFGILISQSGGTLRLSSKNDVSWKIHNLQGKLLFSSNSKETSWNAGNFKGTVIVSANSERKLVAVR